MSELVLKPKKASILVPGYGVVSREDFEPKHAKAIFNSTPVEKEKIIAQHFNVVSYGDLPIFEEEGEAEKPKERKLTKAQLAAKKEKEEAELLAEMEAEEAEKNKA